MQHSKREQKCEHKEIPLYFHFTLQIQKVISYLAKLFQNYIDRGQLLASMQGKQAEKGKQKVEPTECLGDQLQNLKKPLIQQ